MLFEIAAIASMVSGGASYLQGRKASKSAEAAGELNRVSHLVNGQVEAERTRFNAQQLKFQSLLSAEDLKTRAVFTKANQELAKVEGQDKANRFLFQADRIARDAAQKEEDLARDNLGLTRQRSQNQNIFQRSVDSAYLDASRKKAMAKANLASMGVSTTSGISQAIDIDVQTETHKAIIGFSDEILIRERAANTATTKNLQLAKRIRTSAEEDSAYAKSQAEFVGLTVDATDTILDLEVANMINQANFMTWNAEFVEDSAELSAKVLEMGGELKAAQAGQLGAAQASQYRSQGTIGLVQGVGQAASYLYQGRQAKLNNTE